MNRVVITRDLAGGTVRVATACGPRVETLFLGRTPASVLALVPLVYNLCPASHVAAARLALGEPLAETASLDIAAETLREHAVMALRQWPCAVGHPVDRAALAGLTTLTPARLDALEAALFGASAEAVLAGDVRGRSVPADILRRVLSWPPLGRVPLAEDPTFVARNAHRPLVADHMPGGRVTLAARMVASLMEAAAAILALRTGTPPAGRIALTADAVRVEAPRGPLGHHARVSGGSVTRYAVVTPTDRILDRLEPILSASLEAPPSIRALAFDLTLATIDPCVAIEVREAADA